MMIPFNDPELAYLACCYSDKSGFEAENPNFAYTRTKTLIQGDPYCDGCWHDKRHVEKIEHPEEEFYINIDKKTEG